MGDGSRPYAWLAQSVSEVTRGQNGVGRREELSEVGSSQSCRLDGPNGCLPPLSEEGLGCAGCISQGSSGEPEQQGVCLCTHRGKCYAKERLMKWWGC